MTKLVGVFAATVAAAAAVATGVVFFWRKTRKSKNQSRWNAAKSSAVSWSRTAAQGAGRVAGRA
jgi:hypothetical protein